MSTEELCKCWHCRKPVEAHERSFKGGLVDELYHWECRGIYAITSGPGVPRAVPDSRYTVGDLLRPCLCGSHSAVMRVDPDPKKGATFWAYCPDCKRFGRPALGHAAYAADHWNCRTPSEPSAAQRLLLWHFWYRGDWAHLIMKPDLKDAHELKSWHLLEWRAECNEFRLTPTGKAVFLILKEQHPEQLTRQLYLPF